MKMNKTRLLEKISIQSGVSLDECGTVLKTFEKVLSEELSRKMYRYGGWILLLIALFVSVTVFSQTTGRKGTASHKRRYRGGRQGCRTDAASARCKGQTYPYI